RAARILAGGSTAGSSSSPPSGASSISTFNLFCRRSMSSSSAINSVFTPEGPRSSTVTVACRLITMVILPIVLLSRSPPCCSIICRTAVSSTTTTRIAAPPETISFLLITVLSPC
ncbi:hypothetical protein PMAYCL1PPCAC_02739, partial [Pristionchus mayeri]